MKEYCDKCNSKVINGKCDCGIWINREDQPKNISIFEQAILEYNKLNTDDCVLTGNHYTGTSLIIFKGDYNDCMKVKEFINNLHQKCPYCNGDRSSCECEI